MKTCFTAIFGNYDDLKQPFFTSQHWRYVCFTDQDLELPEDNKWEIRKVQLINNDPVKTARYYKIMFHKHIRAEFSLWIDATFIVNIDLNRWWKRYNWPFTTVRHPFDDCLFTDIISCMKGGKGDPGVLARQYCYYESLGIPKHNGLISSGILMRQKTEKVNELCETWWSEVEKWSSRDQVAFGYAQWKHPGVHNSIEWNYTTQKEFIHIPHLHKPWRKENLKEAHRLYGSQGN